MLLRGGARLVDLAARFGIDPGRSHHALDDAVTLARVFGELGRERVVRARKAVLVNLLDNLGLALALEGGDRTGEKAMLFELARRYTLGRFGESLEIYGAERIRLGSTAVTVDQVIERLGGRSLYDKLHAEPDPAQRYPAAMARLRALMVGDTVPLGEAVNRLLERVALSTSREAQIDQRRVNLLTLHSTKGLEFSRVYIVGVEDDQLPGFHQLRDNRTEEIQEARRLLYVGMTRARDRLLLTRADHRFGFAAGDNRFLDEMGIAPVRLEVDA
jgi:superfamily I DNA/RNA helicase